jgi:hypothetical protein
MNNTGATIHLLVIKQEKFTKVRREMFTLEVKPVKCTERGTQCAYRRIGGKQHQYRTKKRYNCYEAGYTLYWKFTTYS